MEVIQIEKVRDPNFVKEVEAHSGQKLSKCYQCGNCTAGCPGGEFYDRQVSQIMRAAQMGLKHEALANRSLWLCLGCATCTARCPNEIDVANVMETLREMAREDGLVNVRSIENFWKAFLDMIRLNGRAYEAGVMADYMLRTGRGWSNVAMAPAALSKGKMPFLPHRIKGRENVARIFKRFAEKRS